MLTSGLLSALPQFEHGFGTRHSALSQEGMASLKQIHSNLVFTVDRVGLAGEGDALVTAAPGVPVSIRTADCLPILLADPRTGAVAAIHAGWRGTAARIVEAAVERLRFEYGSRAQDLIAAIGPGIGECCYQVGEEVARQFGRAGAGKIHLAEHNRAQLEALGILAAKIEIVSPCTYCETETFFSYRREGEAAGRMISFIHLRPSASIRG